MGSDKTRYECGNDPLVINKEAVLSNLVTMICKECQQHGITLKELEGIPPLVKRFYHDNAVPFKHY
ncbi:hypothetical protein QFZ25_001754 [Bacillus atrophaeus]|uniref:hypothetical protein n=1 Tax=Bacillus atrophaeus TaxID=1452 RepID=UPI002282074F|nr:hypothetical protein [Bacillus atrophaeus]MCY8934351.1 hypothetical protein [Bacillus atrophaeus]MDQ0927694.1 hypothetical protein [Bacillus atrophaeus]